ncbi:MAG: hypothetical protein IKL16_01170 [Clostridia bacterium]|nr:hypothetical protein [Clostridia bacterium]
MKIADRIVRALLSFTVIIVAFFTDIVHWIYDLPTEILNQQDNGLTEDSFSLYEIYTQFIDGFNLNLKEMFANGGENEALLLLVPFAKCFAVFFILTLVIALVSGIISIVTSKKSPSFICGGLGIVSLIGMMVSFNKMVAPILSGQVTLGGLFNIPMLGAIVNIQTINLSSAWVFMLMLFIGLILWSLSYLLTSEKNETKAR